MENTMHRLLIAVALLSASTLADAQVYKWTDAGGTVHYSQTPPDQGTKYKEVKTTGTVEPLVSPPAQPAASTDAESANSQPAAPSAPVADTPENRQKMCTSLKANLSALQGSGPVVMRQDGKTVALDGDQRKQQADAAQAQIDRFCQQSQ
jgi:hypothetical protein